MTSHLQKRRGHLLHSSFKENKRRKIQVAPGSEHRRILLTDEKVLTIEQPLNKQNDKVYTQNSTEAFEKFFSGIVLGAILVRFCQQKKSVKTRQFMFFFFLQNFESFEKNTICCVELSFSSGPIMIYFFFD